MRYVLAKTNMFGREQAYRIYVSEALKVGLGLNGRYIDMIDVQSKKIDTRTDKEVRAYYIKKLNEE